MKSKKMKLVLSLILLLSIGTINAQEYNRWAIDVEYGGHAVSDESAVNTTDFPYYGAGVRYNINPKFGLSLGAGFDNIDLISREGYSTTTKFGRGSLEGNINIFKILDLDNNFMTMIAHGGPGISGLYYENPDYNEYTFNLTGGLSMLIRLADRVALKADWRTTINTSQARTLDGYYEISNAQANAIVNNLSAGLVVYLGKNKKHADWYVPEPIAPKVITIDNTKTIYERPQNNITNVYNVAGDEYVYFKNDSYVVDKDGLANIEKAVASAKTKITIIAYCSNVASVEYNLKLANNRANSVRSKIEDLGFSGVIEVKAVGIDNDRKESIYDLARRVQIISE